MNTPLPRSDCPVKIGRGFGVTSNVFMIPVVARVLVPEAVSLTSPLSWEIPVTKGKRGRMCVNGGGKDAHGIVQNSCKFNRYFKVPHE
mgnify:CR=1 FL=1